MKKILVVFALAAVTGCSNQARLDYYAAVQSAAEAQARESEARYQALSTMAAGDGEASVAAVMAIALAQKPVIQPAYIEDDALKWASILTGPLVSLGALAVQADLSRDLNKNNTRVAIERINAEAASDQQLFSALARPQNPSIGNEQLGMVVDGFVQLGSAGLRSTESLGLIGIQSTASTGQAAFTALTGQAEYGYQTVENIVASDNDLLKHVVMDLNDCNGSCAPPCYVCQVPEPDPVVEPPVCSPGPVVSPNIPCEP
jgi:hypothetical protein